MFNRFKIHMNIQSCSISLLHKLFHKRSVNVPSSSVKTERRTETGLIFFSFCFFSCEVWLHTLESLPAWFMSSFREKDEWEEIEGKEAYVKLNQGSTYYHLWPSVCSVAAETRPDKNESYITCGGSWGINLPSKTWNMIDLRVQGDPNGAVVLIWGGRYQVRERHE